MNEQSMQLSPSLLDSEDLVCPNRVGQGECSVTHASADGPHLHAVRESSLNDLSY